MGVSFYQMEVADQHQWIALIKWYVPRLHQRPNAGFTASEHRDTGFVPLPPRRICPCVNFLRPFAFKCVIALQLNIHLKVVTTYLVQT